jgi:outer membrane beta-barrel protein
MDIRFQHILLVAKWVTFAGLLQLSPLLHADQADEEKVSLGDVNNEVFELGVFAGIVNIEDFGSEYAPGISATFRASENFFIQYNYLQTDVSLSPYEKREGTDNYFSGDKRTFKHYDLLLGYNIFQGEFFPSASKASLSTLYLVAGVGEVRFGGESSIAYTAGIGYQVALTRHFGLHIDYRNYIYQSTLITAEKRTVSATNVSTGLKYLF